MKTFTKEYLEAESKYTKYLSDIFYALPNGEQKEKIRSLVLKQREEFETNVWPLTHNLNTKTGE